MKINQNVENFIGHFSPISLDELNVKASMLERSENKYIFNLRGLHNVSLELEKEFDILEIEGKRDFSYETIYFDDDNNISYNHHLQGKRQRFKVRTRKYIDANISFFEVKLKDKRNKTNKRRYLCDNEEHGIFTQQSLNFVKTFHQELYKKDFSYTLKPSARMSYKRITLIAKGGMERLTIDYELCFFGKNGTIEYKTPKDFIIIETKSSNGNGFADKIFKKFKYRSTSCSKFCLSKIILGQVNKINIFLPLLKKYFPDILKNTNVINCLDI